VLVLHTTPGHTSILPALSRVHPETALPSPKVAPTPSRDVDRPYLNPNRVILRPAQTPAERRSFHCGGDEEGRLRITRV